MSLAVVYSRALAGLDAPLVRVEVHVGGGLPCTNIVGLPEKEVREARDRVRAALYTAKFDRPDGRVTVNLAPADLPKESGRFDLPIAIGILAASGQVPAKPLEQLEFAGELGLSGELRPIRGALAMVYRAHRDGRAFVLPESVAAEAALARGAKVLPARTLLDVCGHLNGLQPLAPFVGEARAVEPRYPDLADVRGQAQARRALEIAAAGEHSLLFAGPPGTGKTMLATRIAGILPPMNEEEALEAAAVQSLAAKGFRAERFGTRAFRSPHHTASAVALVGGSSPPRPGEVSLAHHGVLFLDELPEFSRHVLEVLREPLESGRITISRAAQQADFPARFQFIAAMNPCPCGYLGHYSNRCKCSPDVVMRYRMRISGPLLDRIDLHVATPALEASALESGMPGESSVAVRLRVAHARARQVERQGKANARLEGEEMEDHARQAPAARRRLRQASESMMLSARSHHRVLRVARTIADLAHRDGVEEADVLEALQYRVEFRGLPPEQFPALTASHHSKSFRWRFAALLAALSTLGPFSIDAYLPAFAGIQQSLHATPLEIQQTMSAYLFAFGLMFLFHGALSDSFGRRPVILVALVVYTLASIGAALATTAHALILWRVVQGLSVGAGMVVGRAMIRDLFATDDAQRLMSLVTLFFGLAPAIAPIIGGWLFVGLGWRSIFWFLAVVGLILVVVSWRSLPETLPETARQSFHPVALLRGYEEVGINRRFLLLSLAVGFNFNAFFLYVVSAPAFLGEHLQLGPQEYAWLFIPSIVGIMIGARVSGISAGKVSPVLMVKRAYVFMFTAAVGNLAYALLVPPSVPWAMVPIFFYAIGFAMAMPSISLITLDLFPTRRGMAASLQGFVSGMVNTLNAGVISPAVFHSPRWLAVGMLVMMLAGVASWFGYLRLQRPVSEAGGSDSPA